MSANASAAIAVPMHQHDAGGCWFAMAHWFAWPHSGQQLVSRGAVVLGVGSMVASVGQKIAVNNGQNTFKANRYVRL